MSSSRRPVRIANCSGFFGDRLSAAAEVLAGDPVDVLTGDWLAELTMSILAKTRSRGGRGYAHTFVGQLRDVLPGCIANGTRIVSNAGGVDPHGCADAVRALAGELGLQVRVAVIDGDDITPDLVRLREGGEPFAHLESGEPWPGADDEVLAANVYLGGHGVAAALAAGAHVVVTGRLADAALVSGSAAWWHGWGTDDAASLDALAGATLAGHAIECGPQVTGGNFSGFADLLDEGADLDAPGFPVAEIAADGSCVITKQSGTPGAVTLDTVSAQLLYEIGGPRYAVPDVVVRLDTARLDQESPDRVRISGVRGEPAPSRAKALLTYSGGYRNAMTLAVTGLERRRKIDVAVRAVESQLPGGLDGFDDHRVECVGASPDSSRPDDQTFLRISVADPDRQRAGRAFSSAVVATALGGYPGLYLTSPPGDAAEYLVVWPTLVDAGIAKARVSLDGVPVPVPEATRRAVATDPPRHDLPAGTVVDPGATEAVALGHLLHARSGDKGGNANLGLWVPAGAPDPDDRYAWLLGLATPENLPNLLPELAGHPLRCHPLPGLRAVNVEVVGLLGRGVSASLAEDPQAKALGERFRAVTADVPVDLVRRRTVDAVQR